MKKRLCLPSGMNFAADMVRHALAPAWFECPSSSGCRRQKLSPSAYGSVCATTDFFFLQKYRYIIKGKKSLKGPVNFKAMGKADHESQMYIGITLCVCVCYLSKS